jgi:sigma-B regulation protein RsbU (phosphoserine phosphatase)
MKLRWKIFLILLVASLMPMATVVGISQNACRNLGGSISSQAHDALTAAIQSNILVAAQNYALISQRGKISVEFALQSLVQEAEKSMNLPALTHEEVFFAHDFDHPGSGPADLVLSSQHQKLAQNGTSTPKPVSYAHPNFLLAPGEKRDEVADDIGHLLHLEPILKHISRQFDKDVFWVYASLESGVHISYPGHGGYPDDYDPRRRPWYVNAKKQNGLVWSAPTPDATTNQLTFTVSAPFFYTDGTLAGVAAIDVLIPNVLLETEISSQWSRAMSAFLVEWGPGSDQGQNQLNVLAQSTAGGKAMTTSGCGPEADRQRQAEFAVLAGHFANSRSGFVELNYQGVDSFWAFANIFTNLYFVIVVPKAGVMGLPESITTLFSDYTQMVSLISLVAVVVVVVLVAGIAFFLSRSSSRQVMEIVNAFGKLSRGDFSVRIKYFFNDERDLLRVTFNSIVPKLEEHLRMRRALFVAQEVQQSLLPTRNPSLEGFDIAGLSDYCDETGGDYYDFIPTRQGRLAVVVGDVSGHGVSSALLMATARALIMLRASMPGPAAKVIYDVNKLLSMDTSHTGNFMTFFYCELIPHQHQVNWVRAGHDPALVYDPDSDAFDELKGRGCALGLDGSMEYEEFQRTLAPRQIVLIGTDGIWEMHNEQGAMFGKQRLKDIIRRNAAASAQEIVTAVSQALTEFRGNRQPEDDITMVAIKVNP